MLTFLDPLRNLLPARNKYFHWQDYYSLLIRTGCFLQIFPLEFHSLSNTPGCGNPLGLVKVSPHRIPMFQFIFSLYIIDIIYLLTASRRVTLHTVSIDEFTNFFTHFFTRAIAGLFTFASIVKRSEREDFICFVNTLFTHHHQRKENISKSLSPSIHTLSKNHPSRFKSILRKELRFTKIIALMILVTHVQPLGPLGLHLQNRHSNRYWGAQYLPNSLYDCILSKVIFSILDLTHSHVAIFSSVLVAVPLMLYIVFAFSWIGILRRGIEMNMLSFHDSLALLKQQLVFNRIFNQCFAPLIIPMASFAVAVVLILLQGMAINNIRALPLPYYMNILLASVVLSVNTAYFFLYGDRLREYSERVKSLMMVKRNHSFGKNCNMRTVKAQVRSCHILRVQIHTYMDATSESFLSYMLTVVNHSITYTMATR